MSVLIQKYISVVLLGTVKVVLGSLPLSFFYGLDTYTIIGLNMLGGILGIFIFVSLSEFINQSLNTLFKNKKRKHFTFTNRLIIKVKWYGGIYGICFITPLILSIPLGSFLCVRYFKQKGKIILYMIVSLSFWVTLFAFLGGK